MYTVQMSGKGWQVTRPTGSTIPAPTLRFALLLAEGFPVQVLDKDGYVIA